MTSRSSVQQDLSADGGRPLRIGLLSYRSKPHCGGQGVYVRALSRELVALGHAVEVISGPPYPELDPGPRLTRVPSLDLYREPDPFRVPRLRELRSATDVLEFVLMCTAAFPEPLTFSLRAARLLRDRRGDFDVLHDNQTLGYGLLLLQRAGALVVATVHHPITEDRRHDLAAARALTSGRFRKVLSTHRWYSFLRMQGRVVRRLPAVLTVSRSSFTDIVRDFGVPAARLTVVPVGVDVDVFCPPSRPRTPGRVVATASSDVPLKGLVPLLEAVAKLRTERDVELVVVGRPRPGGAAAAAIERLGLDGCVRFVSGVAEDQLVELFGSAEVAVVPSLYEGFSLPAVEAMACATPLVATTAGALPEVVGPDGVTALHVGPGDPEALAAAIGRVLDDPELAARLGAAGRARVVERYTWRAVAQQTVAWYRTVLDAHDRRADRPC